MKTSIFLLTIFFLFASVHTTIISVENACGYTIWAATHGYGGGRRLESGDIWTFEIPQGVYTAGRIWGRTGCNFDASGFGTCQTGDCDGDLECGQTYGKPPITVAEYSSNPFNGMYLFWVSLLDGFNLPMKISSGCSSAIRCSFNITSLCPDESLVPGGCHNPCNSLGECKHSKLFKEICPDACSSLNEENTSVVTCPRETKYRVVFCPTSYSLVCY